MCGIYGYLGSKSAIESCLFGLQKLEYRGYDSAGLALLNENAIEVHKSQGKILKLREKVKDLSHEIRLAIAHTRWATHGKPSDINAHPHVCHQEKVAIVHNGIIENLNEIKKQFPSLFTDLVSDTDSEIIARLISHFEKGNMIEALKKTFAVLKGSYALVAIHKDYPNQIFATAYHSPLVVDVNEMTEEVFLSSDPASIPENHLPMFFLHNQDYVWINGSTLHFYNSELEPIGKEPTYLSIDPEEYSKGNFEHFMLKEIFDQPQSIRQCLDGRVDLSYGTTILQENSLLSEYLHKINRILILGCGSSYHAALMGSYWFEEIARIPTETAISSEYRYSNPIIQEDTLILSISQSGETADTIAAIREIKAKGAGVFALCNVDHSTLVREASETLYLRAGKEVSVCSTKAFTSQLCALLILAIHAARARHVDKAGGISFAEHLQSLPFYLEQVLELESQIAAVAKRLAKYKHFFFLGRRFMFPTALEAALKLKEISYLSASGYPGGELKHGPIALINEEYVTIGLCGNEQTQDKIYSNLQEVKARDSFILSFIHPNQDAIRSISDEVIELPYLPDWISPFTYTIGNQLLAYHIAKECGTDIDQPRNLAKSVTVE